MLGQCCATCNCPTSFDTADVGGFIYSDQFLQLSARLPSHYVYGLGEHTSPLLLSTNWSRFTLMNHDQVPSENPTPAVTFRTIGGVLDFFFFLGPSPAEVVRQFTDVIGKPFMPPFWGLGFHLCRFGYKTLNQTKEVWARNREAGIPLELLVKTLWKVLKGGVHAVAEELVGREDLVSAESSSTKGGRASCWHWLPPTQFREVEEAWTDVIGQHALSCQPELDDDTKADKEWKRMTQPQLPDRSLEEHIKLLQWQLSRSQIAFHQQQDPDIQNLL
ncbi:hypothetical protein PR048_021492 [Dryococelus australis]|uniref:Glycoside hydrolase family 31 TIM barrel domain-containing protein n=1 Tax=Dryococelus australis TaxID=614101 RepID=A0ABQ9GYE3_9NEOP|nr:hypothetical protein PR048_021492 [Dryococelus australis]